MPDYKKTLEALYNERDQAVFESLGVFRAILTSESLNDI